MKVFITGGSGFVGQALTRRLIRRGDDVVILSRNTGRSGSRDPRVRFVKGDPTSPKEWQDHAAKADVCVNLAGASIFNRWTDSYKEKMRASRVETTRSLIRAMTSGNPKEKTLLSTSAVGYYGPRGDEELDESSSPGEDFLADLSVEWEAEALAAEKEGVRVCLMRFGVVLGPGGGALEQMLRIFKKGLGGRLGSGKQWFSWIHLDDLTGAASYLMDNQNLSGPFNFTAPGAVTNRELTKTLAGVLNKPAILPAPASAMKLALGEFAGVLLNGQKVVPRRMLEAGYEFRYPGLDAALRDILDQ